MFVVLVLHLLTRIHSCLDDVFYLAYDIPSQWDDIVYRASCSTNRGRSLRAQVRRPPPRQLKRVNILGEAPRGHIRTFSHDSFCTFVIDYPQADPDHVQPSTVAQL